VGFDQPRTIVPNGYAGELAVPLWARFMRLATQGTKSEWLARPKDVVAMNICRLSGKLPADGCDRVPVETADGYVETRSLIYTEYFKRGTQPSGVCPLHPAPSFMDRLAGFFGADDNREPVEASQVGLPTSTPPAPASTPEPRATPAAAAAAAPAEEPAKVDEDGGKKKKRGFWSRLFGRGKDDDKKEDDKKKPDPPKKPAGR
jgi:hypothetical protein